MGPSERERAAAWAKGKKPCAVCGAAVTYGHHIVTQQKLRQVVAARTMAAALDPYATAPVPRLDRVRWDARNRLWLCERHHLAHHARTKPVAWSVLQEARTEGLPIRIRVGPDSVARKDVPRRTLTLCAHPLNLGGHPSSPAARRGDHRGSSDDRSRRHDEDHD